MLERSITEVDSSIGVSLQPNLDFDFRSGQSVRDIESIVDSRLIENELVVVDRIEGSCSQALT